MSNRPVPTHLKILRGNPGHRPIKDDEPKPDLGAEMPDDLSPAAQKEWPRIAVQLEKCGILTRIDGPALALYCEAYARWRNANDMIAKTGVVLRNPRGMPVQSPYLHIANKAFEQMRRMLIEFGMTPAARTKVTAQKPTQGAPNRFNKFKRTGS